MGDSHGLDRSPESNNNLIKDRLCEENERNKKCGAATIDYTCRSCKTRIKAGVVHLPPTRINNKDRTVGENGTYHLEVTKKIKGF